MFANASHLTGGFFPSSQVRRISISHHGAAKTTDQ
jgi:hypothetical protein